MTAADLALITVALGLLAFRALRRLQSRRLVLRRLVHLTRETAPVAAVQSTKHLQALTDRVRRGAELCDLMHAPDPRAEFGDFAVDTFGFRLWAANQIAAAVIGLRSRAKAL